ncbi:hypothetical protein DXG01_014224 [Tephrocybe rancida]|nr:hypothetical protein DXG01_014224 [Tephrocybe rancida]
MSSTPVALPAIFTSASVDSETLIRTACEAASVIEPWFSAKSEHPILQDLIPRVQNSALLFYDALDVSKKASMDGIRFAQDLSTFWDHLTDERTSTADLQKLIDSMTGTAGEAYNTAVFVSNRFEVASRDICTITNDVPLQLTSLADEEQYHKKKLVASEKKIRIVKGAKVTSSAAAAIVAVVAGAIFPPALIAFPIVLPLVTLVLEGTQIHLEKEMKKRETKLHKCTDAMDQLSRASGDLVKLKNCVDQFAYFWKHVEIALHVIKGRVEELRKDEHTRLQLSTLKNSCLRLEKSFFEYTAKVRHDSRV